MATQPVPWCRGRRYRRRVVIGRANEVGRLSEVVSGLSVGTGFAVVLRGAAGVGKSTLLDVVASDAQVRVLRATGVESESRIAFTGLHELLQPVLAEVDALPPMHRSVLRRCLGLEPGDTGEMSGYVAVAALMISLAQDRPLLCMIDDAHWLDESSANAILFAARRHPERAGFVFGVREGQPSRFDEPWLPRLDVGPLTEPDSCELVQAVAPHLTASVTARVVAAGEGNPLALVEFSRLAGRDDSWADVAWPLPVDDRLKVVFTRQTRMLPECTQRALVLLAAAEVDLLGPISAALVGFVGNPRALDPAADAGLLSVTDSVVRFRHPLVRSALYHAAPLAVRRDAHAAIAEALCSGQPERAAWHRALATLALDDAVADALVETADLARRRGGHAAEARALERAARLTRDPAVMTARLLAAAQATLEAGKHDHSAGLLAEVVARTDDPVLLADAEHELARLAFRQHGKRLPTVMDTVAKVEPVDRRRAARLLSHELVPLISDYQVDVAVPIAERAWALVDRAVEPFDVTFRVAHVLLMAGRTDEGAALADAVADAAQAADSLSAMTDIARTLTWLEHYPDAYAILETAEARLRSVDGRWMLGHALVALADLHRRTGALAGARSAAAEALSLAEQLGEPMQQAEALAQLAAAESALGHDADARAHAEDALSLAAGRPCGTGELHALAALTLGGSALAAGRAGEAVDHLAPSVRRLLGDGVADPAVVPGIADLIEAYAVTGRADEAAALLDWLSAHAVSCGRRWAMLAAARCAVRLGRPGAERDLRRALHQDDGYARVESGRSWLVLGSLQRRHGNRRAATESLHQAHQLLSASGAAAWTDRVAEELRACGHAVAGSHSDPLTALTPQEMRVVQLVARGDRNREVAAALFVSEKTVETHLAAAYRKLGIRSRSQLAARIAESTQGKPQGFS
jgi:DNA-binding CsgD family transcriptional regulator